MKTVWTDGLDEEVKKDIRGDFKSSRILRKRMKTILEDKIDSKRTEVRNKVNYDKNNWSEFMADSLGYERAMYEIISLIDDFS